METAQKTAPSATKVLLFRSQGADMLREAKAAGVLTPEVNHQIEQVVSENERLRAENDKLRELTISQRMSIIGYRSRRLESYRHSSEPTVPRSQYVSAILSAISFLITTIVLVIVQIATLI